MSKTERISLIRARMAALTARVGVSLGAMGMIPVSRQEIQQEASAITMTSATNDETREESEIGWQSHLPFDHASFHVSDKDSILSPAERKQLARDMARKRAFQALINTPPTSPA